jgi:hypothetical protein
VTAVMSDMQALNAQHCSSSSSLSSRDIHATCGDQSGVTLLAVLRSL